MTVAEAQVTADPAIHRGEPVVEGTSTPVRAIAERWNLGMPAEEIPVHLPHLTLPQVFESLSYYLTHRQAIDGYIAANRLPDQWRGKGFAPPDGKGRVRCRRVLPVLTLYSQAEWHNIVTCA